MGASITGWGAALPPGELPNPELAALLDVSDEWIRDRTGIRSRHIVAEGESTSSLAAEAARQAIARATIDPAEVDMIIVATSTPDFQLPATASLVQHALGCSRAGAFDVNAACAGFLYALAQADASITSGMCSTVVVCGADVLSPITDYSDPRSCVLFGDGAGAVVVQRTDGSSLGPFVFRSEGGATDDLYVRPDERLIRMNGREVYRRAVDAMSDVLVETLDAGSTRLGDIDLILAHQANGRILEAIAHRLGVDESKVAVHIGNVGNTSAASIPLALADAADSGRLHSGARIAFAAFGAGFTWGGALATWQVEDAPPPRRRLPALVGTVGHLLEVM